MSLRTEIAEVMQNTSKMCDVAEKITYKRNLSAEEKEVFEISDAWAREIGKTGNDKDHEIAAFVQKVVNEELYNAPDELLDSLFDRGSVGEFDYVEYTKTPENTLQAHEAAKGGTVRRSWIDWSKVQPITKNRQVETDLNYIDLRKNGFKAISTLTTYAKEALQNALFYDVFAQVDAALVSGANVISNAGALTQDSWDKFSLYLNDMGANPTAVCLSKYAQAAGRMAGRTQYLSESQKDAMNRYGLMDFVDGVKIASVATNKLVNGKKLALPDKRIFGVVDKIGALSMVGEIHTYEDHDNSNEKIVLRIKDFTYSVAITNIENCAKISFTE